MHVELRDHTTQRGDAVAFANAQHSYIQAVSATVQGCHGVGQCYTGVVMAVEFNADIWIALVTETSQPLNLARHGNANGIGQANPLYACVNYSIKYGQQI